MTGERAGSRDCVHSFRAAYCAIADPDRASACSSSCSDFRNRCACATQSICRRAAVLQITSLPTLAFEPICRGIKAWQRPPMQRSPSRLHTRTRPHAHQERSRCLHIRMDRCKHTQAGAFGATCESFASCSHIASLPHTSERVGSAGLHMQMQHRCTTAKACKRRTHSCVRVRPCAWVCVLCARAAARDGGL